VWDGAEGWDGAVGECEGVWAGAGADVCVGVWCTGDGGAAGRGAMGAGDGMLGRGGAAGAAGLAAGGAGGRGGGGAAGFGAGLGAGLGADGAAGFGAAATGFAATGFLFAGAFAFVFAFTVFFAAFFAVRFATFFALRVLATTFRRFAGAARFAFFAFFPFLAFFAFLAMIDLPIVRLPVIAGRCTMRGATAIVVTFSARHTIRPRDQTASLRLASTLPASGLRSPSRPTRSDAPPGHRCPLRSA
jgi:hypothetical protein